MRKTSGLLLPALLLIAGCAAEEPAGPPLDMRHNTRDLMAGMIDASADALWDAVGTVWDENGEQYWQPETEEEWLAVTGAAMTLVESGNLLMLGDRPPDDTQWMSFAQDMIDAGPLRWRRPRRAIRTASSTAGKSSTTPATPATASTGWATKSAVASSADGR